MSAVNTPGAPALCLERRTSQRSNVSRPRNKREKETHPCGYLTYGTADVGLEQERMEREEGKGRGGAAEKQETEERRKIFFETRLGFLAFHSTTAKAASKSNVKVISPETPLPPTDRCSRRPPAPPASRPRSSAASSRAPPSPSWPWSCCSRWARRRSGSSCCRSG